jgi:hypothetical protein
LLKDIQSSPTWCPPLPPVNSYHPLSKLAIRVRLALLNCLVVSHIQQSVDPGCLQELVSGSLAAQGGDARLAKHLQVAKVFWYPAALPRSCYYFHSWYLTVMFTIPNPFSAYYPIRNLNRRSP